MAGVRVVVTETGKPDLTHKNAGLMMVNPPVNERSFPTGDVANWSHAGRDPAAPEHRVSEAGEDPPAPSRPNRPLPRVEREKLASVREGKTPGVIAFSEQSILGFKAATKDLLPIFARHFADVRLVYVRDRLEISASFRSPAELNPLEARRRDHHAIQPSQAAPPAAPMGLEQPAALLQPKRARVVNGRRLGLIVVASLGAVILGWPFLGNLHKAGNTPATPTPSVGRGSIPGWVPGLEETSLGGWIEIQTRFDLPDATVRSAIQILRKNDKYHSAHSLHDLAKYPAQVRRAFSLLAGPQTGTPFDFDALMNDLKARVVAGTRFPDEPPGGHYSNLEREFFNNIVVLTIIELFNRRQDDPSVKEILAALRRDRP